MDYIIVHLGSNNVKKQEAGLEGHQPAWLHSLLQLAQAWDKYWESY